VSFFLPPNKVLPNDSFISIVVTTFHRDYYLPRLLSSLESVADMPYEIIVNDDGSNADVQAKILGMSERLSSAVFNFGGNMGLNAAVNRAVSIASSKFILFVPDDVVFVVPCFRNLCAVLSRPYVGLVSPLEDGTSLPLEDRCVKHGVSFGLYSGLAAPGVSAFRKDIWEEVGGWDTRCPSCQSDNVFFHKVYKAGYWRATLGEHAAVTMNEPLENSEYVPTSGLVEGSDCCIPKIVGIQKEISNLISVKRRESCHWWVDGERTIPNREEYRPWSVCGRAPKDTRKNPKAGLNDLPYWEQYFLDVFSYSRHSSSVRGIDWSVAARHGQSKWQDEIKADFL